MEKIQNLAAQPQEISAVTLTQTIRNAPKVVRKIYRPMDPIRLRVPAHGKNTGTRDPPVGFALQQTTPFMLTLIGQQNGLAKAKPFEYAQQFVNRGRAE